MGDLRVELYGVHVGDIVGTDSRTFDFVTSRDAFTVFPLGSRVLSESVPLVPIQNRGRAARRRNFFAELLPEGNLLEYLANQAGLPPYDVVQLLSVYGRDVAGAVQIYDPNGPNEPRIPYSTRVDDSQIAQMLPDVRTYPLGNVKGSGKTSLAGVQAKIALARKGGNWHQARDGYPSTHILKPQTLDYPTMIFDEEYGSRLARGLGLASHDTRVNVFNGVNTLVIERYDRSPDSPNGRIHQEDMNQVLGAHGIEKYQSRGGKVSLKRIARVFLARGQTESAHRLLQLTTMSVAVGNLDLHAKNLSILHPFDGPVALAPAYDIVPQTHFANDGETALAINGKYVHTLITTDDLVAEAESWGLASAEGIVRDTLVTLTEIAIAEKPLPGSYEHIRDDVLRFCENLIAGRAAGAES